MTIWETKKLRNYEIMGEKNYIELQDFDMYKLSREYSKLAWEIYQTLDWQLKKIIGD